MATKVHHVKKCRKDNAVVKRGDSYYWWKLPMGEKQISATYPKRSQLTGSDYLGCVFDLQDSLTEDYDGMDGPAQFEEVLDEIVEQVKEIQEQQQENLDAMMPSLHNAPNGRLLLKRLEVIPEIIEELDGLIFEECSVDGALDVQPILDVLVKLEVTRKGKEILMYREKPDAGE